MQKFRFFTLCWSVIFMLSCSITRNTATSQNQQPQRPMESYETPVEFTPSVSTVNIPVRLSATQLEKLLNNRLNGVIYDDSNLDDDGLMLKATKSQNITTRLEGLQMTYRVPLKLWVFKKYSAVVALKQKAKLPSRLKQLWI